MELLSVLAGAQRYPQPHLIVAAFNFVGEGVTDWGALMAAATLIALPPVVVTLLGQRWLVAGLTAGAVKG